MLMLVACVHLITELFARLSSPTPCHKLMIIIITIWARCAIFEGISHDREECFGTLFSPAIEATLILTHMRYCVDALMQCKHKIVHVKSNAALMPRIDTLKIFLNCFFFDVFCFSGKKKASGGTNSTPVYIISGLVFNRPPNFIINVLVVFSVELNVLLSLATCSILQLDTSHATMSERGKCPLRFSVYYALSYRQISNAGGCQHLRRPNDTRTYTH